MVTCPDISILRAFADGDTALAVDEELMRHIESCEKCQTELDDLTALGPVHVPPAVAIPGFKIHRVLGKGGMGHVFEATDEATGRQVALKVLPAASLPRRVELLTAAGGSVANWIQIERTAPASFATG